MWNVQGSLWNLTCSLRSHDSSIWRVPGGACQTPTKLSLHYTRNAGLAKSQQRSQHKTKREQIHLIGFVQTVQTRGEYWRWVWKKLFGFQSETVFRNSRFCRVNILCTVQFTVLNSIGKFSEKAISYPFCKVKRIYSSRLFLRWLKRKLQATLFGVLCQCLIFWPFCATS